jgi:hypothetical protein
MRANRKVVSIMSKETAPIATIIVGVIVVIVVLSGAIVTIVNPDALSFQQYLDALVKAAIGAGALGIGRGILGAAREGRRADAADAPAPTVYGGRR